MQLGFFTMPVHPQGRPYWQTLKEDREAFILADQLGYTEGYCGEHLTDAVENIPNSMMFIATLVGCHQKDEGRHGGRQPAPQPSGRARLQCGDAR